jgi:hypothetical protein
MSLGVLVSARSDILLYPLLILLELFTYSFGVIRC